MEEQPSPSADAAMLAGEEMATHPLRARPAAAPSFIPGQAWQLQPPPSCTDQPCNSSSALPFPLQPFWPLGTGVARGFLAAFDAAWMVRRWAAGTPPLEVLAER